MCATELKKSSALWCVPVYSDISFHTKTIWTHVLSLDFLTLIQIKQSSQYKVVHSEALNPSLHHYHHHVGLALELYVDYAHNLIKHHTVPSVCARARAHTHTHTLTLTHTHTPLQLKHETVCYFKAHTKMHVYTYGKNCIQINKQECCLANSALSMCTHSNLLSSWKSW